MLLTLKPMSQNGISSPHAFPSPKTRVSRTYSPPPPPAPSSNSLLSLPDNEPRKMSAPLRGLPPPLAMTLPNPDRGPPPPPIQSSQGPQHLAGLPAPQSNWSNSEEGMRSWYAAKTEEDKRKQEEEKTRQESLRLEQRKIEQSMLRESLQGGVPPAMVPMVFAGMGGANLANASLEWAQHYLQQLSIQQQQQQPPQHPPPQQIQYMQQQQQHPQQQQQQGPLPQQSSPDIRRDRAGGPGANPYAQHPVPNAPGPSAGQGGFNYDRGRVPQAIQAAPTPTSAPRGASSALARLTTGEVQIQPPPPGGAQLPLPPQQIQQITAGPDAQQQQQQPQQLQQPPQQQQPSQAQNTPTSIYFHHWVPPAANKEPPTPSSRSTQGSPHTQPPASHLRSAQMAEYAHSPKKRKTNSGEGSTAPGSRDGVGGNKAGTTSPALSQLSSAGRRRAPSVQNSSGSGSSRGERPDHGGPLSTSEGETGGRRDSAQEEARPSRRASRHGTPAGADRLTPKREAEREP